jgi:hypothetical protein
MASFGINPLPIIGLLLIGVSIAGRQALNRIRERYAANWPLTDGEITTTKVKVIRAERGELALAELGYSYRVNGGYRSGYYKQQFTDEQDAWTFVDGMRGQSVVIRYQADRPDVSLLREGDQSAHFDRSSLLKKLFPRVI